MYVGLVLAYAAYMFIKSIFWISREKFFSFCLVKSRSGGKSSRYGRKNGKSVTDKKSKNEVDTKVVDKNDEQKAEVSTDEPTQKTNIESRVAKIEKAIVKLVQMHEELAEKVDSVLIENSKANQNILDNFLDEKPSGSGF